MSTSSQQHQVVAEIIETELNVGDHVRFAVTSNSMRPLMQAGDSAVVEIKTPDKIRRGDIVVLLRTNDYLTHRAIQLIGERWQTKGDSNTQIDPQEQQKRILGCVTQIRQNTKTIDLQTPKWAIINPALACLSLWDAKAYQVHRWLRFPFRAVIRLIITIFT